MLDGRLCSNERAQAVIYSDLLLLFLSLLVTYNFHQLLTDQSRFVEEGGGTIEHVFSITDVNAPLLELFVDEHQVKQVSTDEDQSTNAPKDNHLVFLF